MFDFLYTLGLCVIRPALVKAVSDLHPKFFRVQRTITEIDAAGKETVVSKGSPQTGNLDKDSTEAVRARIGQFVKGYSQSAPPIGIYTAGRFCQLVNVPYFSSAKLNNSSFADIVALFHSGYLEAMHSEPESTLPTFPAFLGLIAMDAKMRFQFNQPTDQLDRVLSEFGIVRGRDREWDIALRYDASQGFQEGVTLYMQSDSDPWEDVGSGETFFWWNDIHTAHVIP
jgi:hypothetical protein